MKKKEPPEETQVPDSAAEEPRCPNCGYCKHCGWTIGITHPSGVTSITYPPGVASITYTGTGGFTA